jgi:predicted phage terminase large subunit-like protein
MKLTAEIIEAMSGVYLSPLYDTPSPTPQFHRDCWALYTSDARMAAVAAPRGHAKSTALTHDYVLAVALFRDEQYIIIVGASEEMAIEHLGDIANELRENEELIAAFKIKNFVTDQKTDIIVECQDGYQFRIMARGSEQKIRGKKWRGRRPGLIVGDDLEDDEQVENRDRRLKFSRWFYRACVQALRDKGKIRVHGTILQEDSLLAGLVKHKSWSHLNFRAHKSFDDFDDILWPEKFSAERLKAIRQSFIEKGDSAGYSQEYLNDPFDNDAAYLRRDDFLPMKEEDFEAPKVNYVGCDFAISVKDKANRTSFTIGGLDTQNLVHIIDQRVDRWNSLEIVEEFFSIQIAHRPACFFVEKGQIWSSLEPMLQREMHRRNIWISFEPLASVSDKKVRGRAYQRRHRAHGMRFDKEATWYPGFEDENMRFTGDNEAVLDDQFDSPSILCRGLEEKTYDLDKEDFMTESEEDFEMQSEFLRASNSSGRNAVTGY